MSAIPYPFSPQEITALTLQALLPLRRRAESAPDKESLRNYFPIISPNALLSANTQVIFGRNGTGKTHILRSAEEYCRNNYHVTKAVPVYFDMRKFGLSRVSADTTHEEFIEKYYRDFVAHITGELVRFFDEASTNGLLKKWLDSGYLPARSALKKAVKTINKAFDFDNFTQRVESYVRTIKSNQQDKKNATVSSHISLHDWKQTADAGASIDQSRINSDDIEIVVKGAHVIQFAEIVREIENILAAIGANSLIIMIDEWAQLDIRLQPLFAELIRRTLSTSNKIHLKIAAIKYQSQFSCQIPGNPQRLGLVTGVDITELTDLNQIFTYDLDNHSVKIFLTHILSHHVGAEISNILKDQFPVVMLCEQEFYRVLVNNIFACESAYDYIIQASEGNPRDFLAILSECCTTHGSLDALPISKDAAAQSAVGHFNGMKSQAIDCDETLELFNSIFRHCVREESKVFLLSTDLCRRDDRINKLWNYRFIHLIDSNFVVTDKRDTAQYCVFSIDYGKILSLTNSEDGRKAHDSMIRSIRRIVSALFSKKLHLSILNRLKKNHELRPHILALMKLGTTSDDGGVTAADLTRLVADSLVRK